MESLALFVAVLLLIAITAGPFAIAISATKVKKAINAKESLAWLAVEIFRKIFHCIAILLGFIFGFQLIFLAVFAGKLIGVWSILTSYIGLRREYFPDFYVVRNMLSQLGIKRKEEPRFFSGDGTEIIRAKKTTRFGRTSGRDGHGPGGQH
jgi:hypothetical protein